jgi:hypothetical protein
MLRELKAEVFYDDGEGDLVPISTAELSDSDTLFLSREEKEKKKKEMKKSRNLKYYEKNKDKVKEIQKKYQTTHKERNNEYMKEWRTANPEKVKKSRNKYIENNHEKLKEHRKEKITCDMCGAVIARASKYSHSKTQRCKIAGELARLKLSPQASD